MGKGLLLRIVKLKKHAVSLHVALHGLLAANTARREVRSLFELPLKKSDSVSSCTALFRQRYRWHLYRGGPWYSRLFHTIISTASSSGNLSDGWYRR